MSQERHTTVNPTPFLYFLQKAPEANLKALKKQEIGQNVCPNRNLLKTRKKCKSCAMKNSQEKPIFVSYIVISVFLPQNHAEFHYTMQKSGKLRQFFISHFTST